MNDKQPFQQHIAFLRETFLDQAPERRFEDYWKDHLRLTAYDQTLARRILWKWQAVLSVAQEAIRLPSSYVLLDWGCGSGVASEAWLTEQALPRPKEVILYDRSQLAMNYSEAKIADLDPGLPVRKLKDTEPFPPQAVVLLSHVINELPQTIRENLLKKLERASLIVWVEPGSKEASLLLGAAQRLLRPNFPTLFPCPHQHPCPQGVEATESNWCHFFAKPPAAIFHSSEWATFARQNQIDLTSLPLSFLVASRLEKTATSPGNLILGKPNVHKGYADVILCSRRGLLEKERLQAKRERSFIKQLSKQKNLLHYRDELNEDP